MTAKEQFGQDLIKAACDFVRAKQIERETWDQVSSAILEEKQAKAEYNGKDAKPYLEATKKAKEAWDKINDVALKREITWEKLVDAKTSYDQYL